MIWPLCNPVDSSGAAENGPSARRRDKKTKNSSSWLLAALSVLYFGCCLLFRGLWRCFDFSAWHFPTPLKRTLAKSSKPSPHGRCDVRVFSVFAHIPRIACLCLLFVGFRTLMEESGMFFSCVQNVDYFRIPRKQYKHTNYTNVWIQTNNKRLFAGVHISRKQIQVFAVLSLLAHPPASFPKV